MAFSWTAWLISVIAVVVSGAIAASEGNWRRRPGLEMGFVNHGGMWGDLVLLPIANAAIVPHIDVDIWLALAVAVCGVASAWVHIHWYRGQTVTHSREHMWPSRPHGVWWRDLSWSGWAHVLYVIGELSVLVGFLIYAMPDEVIAVVAIIFTLHVPLGLLQPRWFLTGQIATPRQQPLLLPLLATLWVVAFIKL